MQIVTSLRWFALTKQVMFVSRKSSESEIENGGRGRYLQKAQARLFQIILQNPSKLLGLERTGKNTCPVHKEYQMSIMFHF